MPSDAAASRRRGRAAGHGHVAEPRRGARCPRASPGGRAATRSGRACPWRASVRSAPRPRRASRRRRDTSSPPAATRRRRRRSVSPARPQAAADRAAREPSGATTAGDNLARHPRVRQGARMMTVLGSSCCVCGASDARALEDIVLIGGSPRDALRLARADASPLADASAIGGPAPPAPRRTPRTERAAQLGRRARRRPVGRVQRRPSRGRSPPRRSGARSRRLATRARGGGHLVVEVPGRRAAHAVHGGARHVVHLAGGHVVHPPGLLRGERSRAPRAGRPSSARRAACSRSARALRGCGASRTSTPAGRRRGRTGRSTS